MGTPGRTEYEGYFSGWAISACITRIAAFQWVVLARSTLVAHRCAVGTRESAEGPAGAFLASQRLCSPRDWTERTGWT